MKIKAMIIIMILSLGVTTMVKAQKPERDRNGQNRLEYLKKELNLTEKQQEQGQSLMDTFRKEMFSKVMKARIAFDNELSANEKEVISEFREKLEAKTETRPGPEKIKNGFHHYSEDAPVHPKPPFTREEIQRLIDISQAHQEQLEEVFKCIYPERMAMRNVRGEGEKTGDREPLMRQKDHDAIRFLLMDPSQAEEMGENKGSSIMLYPNPAYSKIHIRFMIDTAQTVKVELYNINGTLHEILSEAEVAEGEQTYAFDISQLPSNTIYFIKTTMAYGTEVRKFLINR